MTDQPSQGNGAAEAATPWGARLLGWPLINIVAAVLAVLIGASGWYQTDPSLTFDEILYRTLALFAINFDSDLPPSLLLNIARFLALGVVYVALIRVGIEVLTRRGTVGRAARMKRHSVVLGSCAEAGEIASRLRKTGAYGKVTLVGELDVSDRKQIDRDRVTHIPGADQRDLGRILAEADRVIVAEPTDEDAARTLNRVRAADGKAPVTVLVDAPGLAELLSRTSGAGTVCRPRQVAFATLRVTPPFLATAMVPSPIVIGEGPLAAEMVRRIVLGWQQPAERIIVHTISRSKDWQAEATAGIEDHVGLRTTRPKHYSPQAIGRLVAQFSQEYAAGVGTGKFTVKGPGVYVVHDKDTVSAPIAQAVVEAWPRARVAALVEDASIWEAPDAPANLRFRSLRELLRDPALLLLNRTDLLAEEIRVDDERWPGTSGLLSSDATANRLARAASGLLEEAGIRVDGVSDGEPGSVVLEPSQLRTIADGLRAELTMSDPPSSGLADDARLVEFAARLPLLAARAGFNVHNGAASGLTADEVARLAMMVHDGYLETGRQSRNATGSANAYRAFSELSDVDRRSNAAQVVDIPAKLTVEGLGWRRAADPRLATLTCDQVERLAQLEHRRWHHFQLRNGRPDHPHAVSWEALEAGVSDYDRDAVRAIPGLLAAVGIEIVADNRGRMGSHREEAIY